MVRIRGLQNSTGLIAGTLSESLSGDQSVLGQMSVFPLLLILLVILVVILLLAH